MLSVFRYLLIVIVLLLVGTYFYVESERKKAIAEHKRAISLRVAKMKSKFKDELLRFVEQEVISIPQHEVLYRVANNFFIFQPINDKSIGYCEFTLNNITGALLNITPDMPNHENVKDQFTVFVSKLPMQAREFNPNFYKVKLPKLIDTFVQAKEEIKSVDAEISILDHDVEPDDTTNVKEIIKDDFELAVHSRN